jgi:hypothetical protein
VCANSAEDMYHSGTFTGGHVSALREASAVPVGPPCPMDVQILAQMDYPSDDETSTPPDWLGWMSYHRVFFGNTLLRVIGPASVDTYKFVFALQAPRALVCVCAVTAVELAHPCLSSSEYVMAETDLWEHTFKLDWSGIKFSDAGVFTGAIDVEVLQDVLCDRDDLLRSDMQWVPLLSLKDVLQDPPTGFGATVATPAASCTAELPIPAAFMEHPEMWEHIKEDLGHCTKKTSCDDDMSSDDMADDDDMLDAMDRLLIRREELALEFPEDPDMYFKWTLRGGKWTASKFGVAYDCYMAMTIKGPATRFTTKFGLVPSASFSILKYGEIACLQLANGWIHRMFYLLAVWKLAAFADDFVFDEATIASYVRSDTFVAFLATAPLDVQERAQKFDHIAPR